MPQGDEELFQEATYARDVLMDQSKRKVYDERGHEGLEKMGEGNDGSPFPGGFPFGDFFGGGQQAEAPRGDDVVVPLLVTLEELYGGTEVKLTMTEKSVRDAPGTRECNCHMEMRTVQRGPGQMEMHQHQVCEQCPNIRLVEDDVDIDVVIQPGMAHGDLITYPGQGELEIDGENGDLIIGLHQVAHPIFERIGNDLYTNLTISLEDALLGFATEPIHLDGKVVKVSRKATTWNGFKQRIVNKGMPIRNDRGTTKYGSLV